MYLAAERCLYVQYLLFISSIPSLLAYEATKRP